MPPKHTIRPDDFPVRPARVYLGHAHFYDPGNTPEKFSDEQSFRVGLDLERPDPQTLTVLLTVSTGPDAPLACECTYAVDYVMRGTVPPEEQEELWRRVAFVMAPRLLYPYVREFFTNITARWRGRSLTLPFSTVPLPPMEDVVIPPARSAEYQPELPLIENPASGAADAATPRRRGRHAKRRED